MSMKLIVYFKEKNEFYIVKINESTLRMIDELFHKKGYDPEELVLKYGRIVHKGKGYPKCPPHCYPFAWDVFYYG